MKTLGGVFFCYQGILHDYNVKETIDCLKSLCDQVVVIDCGSTDGSAELIKSLEDEKMLAVLLEKEEWDKRQGKEKISWFQNLAVQFLTTNYYVVLQADECLHEKDFPAIREAIEEGFEAYYVTRINLWKDSKHKLIVPHERQPCGTNIIRLAKLQYLSVGDGESLECQLATDKYKDLIKIWHMGFVRSKYVMKEKIRHMQEDVFGLGHHDPKLDNMEVFDWNAWFTRWDLQEHKEELPIFIQEWAKKRDEINLK